MNRNFLEKIEYTIRAIVGILAFTFLWDTSGPALGATLITLPNFFMTFASMLGSAVWIVGTVALIFAVFALLAVGAIHNGDISVEDYVSRVTDGGIDPNKEMKFGITSKTAIVVSIVGILSGFYFTGISTLLFIGGIQFFNHIFLDKARRKGLLEQ